MAERRVMEVQVMAWPAFLDGAYQFGFVHRGGLHRCFGWLRQGSLPTIWLSVNERSVC